MGFVIGAMILFLAIFGMFVPGMELYIGPIVGVLAFIAIILGIALVLHKA